MVQVVLVLAILGNHQSAESVSCELCGCATQVHARALTHKYSEGKVESPLVPMWPRWPGPCTDVNSPDVRPCTLGESYLHVRTPCQRLPLRLPRRPLPPRRLMAISSSAWVEGGDGLAAAIVVLWRGWSTCDKNARADCARLATLSSPPGDDFGCTPVAVVEPVEFTAGSLGPLGGGGGAAGRWQETRQPPAYGAERMKPHWSVRCTAACSGFPARVPLILNRTGALPSALRGSIFTGPQYD
jgi:hypothetical protein